MDTSLSRPPEARWQGQRSTDVPGSSRVDLLVRPPGSASWTSSTPEVLLPTQATAGPPLGAAFQPEMRLMLAVLEHAVEEIHRGVLDPSWRGHRAVADAAAWVAEDDLRWPYSFVNVCLVLGFDPGAVRAGLVRRFGARAVRHAAPRLGLRERSRASARRARIRGHAATLTPEAPGVLGATARGA